MNLKTDILDNSDETFNIYASKFLERYRSIKSINIDKLDFDSEFDYYQCIHQNIIININSEDESAESLTQIMLLFVFNELGKLTIKDGKIKIDSDNSFLKWTEIEQKNYSTIFGKVSKLFDQAVDASNLSEIENNDWFLDHLNFTQKFLSAPYILFDDKIKGYNHLYRES